MLKIDTEVLNFADSGIGFFATVRVGWGSSVAPPCNDLC